MYTFENYTQSLKKLTPNEIMKLFLNIEGVRKADEGYFNDALECFSKAIELPPKDSVSYFNSASVKMYLGDVKGAASDLKEMGTSGLSKVLAWMYHIIFYVLILILFL